MTAKTAAKGEATATTFSPWRKDIVQRLSKIHSILFQVRSQDYSEVDTEQAHNRIDALADAVTLLTTAVSELAEAIHG